MVKVAAPENTVARFAPKFVAKVALGCKPEASLAETAVLDSRTIRFETVTLLPAKKLGAAPG